MKRYIFPLIVMVSSADLSGCVAMANAPLPEKTEVVEFPGVKQADIYANSKIWIAKAFKSANNVIQYADKEQGSIVGKGAVDYPCADPNECLATSGMVINFTMKIDTKDGKARVTLSDYSLYKPTSTSLGVIIPASTSPVMTVPAQTATTKAMNDLIAQYKREAVNQDASNKNW
ncbi:DUF4468 domain-containing protein [Enterobacter mori]|uniref:DUF4468 domain-containing protein n=1 Tax=Enterobacter mori TaxID=539813 RepID=UPI003AB08172